MLKKRLPRIRNFIRTNPGAPYILLFQVVFIIAAIFHAMNAESVANELSIYAFYTLIIGVSILVVKSIISSKRKA